LGAAHSFLTCALEPHHPQQTNKTCTIIAQSLIYETEKKASEAATARAAGDPTTAATAEAAALATDAAFGRALEVERHRVLDFYKEKAAALVGAAAASVRRLETIEVVAADAVARRHGGGGGNTPRGNAGNSGRGFVRAGSAGDREAPPPAWAVEGGGPAAASFALSPISAGTLSPASINTSPAPGGGGDDGGEAGDRAPLLARQPLSPAAAAVGGAPALAAARSASLPRAAPELEVLERRATALARGAAAPGVAGPLAANRLDLEDLFVALTALREFHDLNRAGFRKALKKHDKVLAGVPGWPPPGAPLGVPPGAGATIATSFDAAPVAPVDAALAATLRAYSVAAAGGSPEAAAASLRGRLRDRLVMERGTIWQDMAGAERRTLRGAAARVEAGALPSGVGGGGLLLGHLSHSSALPRPSSVTPLGSLWAAYGRAVSVAAAVAAFACILAADPKSAFGGHPEQRNCAALVALVSILWATEALPLFATAMLVPGLAIVLRVMVDRTEPGGPPVRLTPRAAAPLVFHAMMSQVIMLLLGGFAIAAALSKHFIAKWVATAVLSRAGSSPQALLLGSMGVAAFASMWLSNVAAPVLTYSLLAPVLRTLPASPPGTALARALVLGVALASNLGGMTSPIASPQNVFAIERMTDPATGDAPSWLQWFSVSLPIVAVGLIICWAALLVAYRDLHRLPAVRQLPPTKDRVTGTQLYVVAVSAGTVCLWCANGALAPLVGEMGVIALLPLIAFFGTGVLTKDDFNSMLWNVVMLAMGGLALGAAVDSSGLLKSVAAAAAEAAAGLSVWQVHALFCGLVLIATTFISHTVGAMIILPVVERIGRHMLPEPHARLLVMGAALMCSGAMGLPVSGFPNMTAVSLEGPDGRTYLTATDFLAVGVPCSVAAYGLVVTLGYALMRGVNGW
jgi:phosphate transporter